MKPALASRQRRSVCACSRSIRSKSAVRTGCEAAGSAVTSRRTSAAARTAGACVLKVAAMATILHSTYHALRPLVGAGQPLTKQLGGFVRGRPVERHQGRGNAGNPDNVSAPAVLGDRRDLD